MTPDTLDSLSSDLQHAVRDAFFLEHELGVGGVRRDGPQLSARVFVAREPTASRQVVLTVLPDELAARVDAERFRREIELAAELRHPQIVALLAAGASGPFLYYTMPYLEADSLRHWLDASGGRLPIREALRIGADVAGALQAAHEQGFVHRDVRPENVLLTGRHAVVTNVGAARAVCRSLAARDAERRAPHEASVPNGAAHPSWLIGTPCYMSPEQTSGATNLDGRSDVYSLGCILYEMLTGTRPFSGTPGEVLRWRRTALPEPPRRRRKELPLSLDRIVMKALATKAEARYATAGELQRALLAAPASAPRCPIAGGAIAALQGVTLGMCRWR